MVNMKYYKIVVTIPYYGIKRTKYISVDENKSDPIKTVENYVEDLKGFTCVIAGWNDEFGLEFDDYYDQSKGYYEEISAEEYQENIA